MRAHPTWQRPLDVDISFFRSSPPPLDKHLACYRILPYATFDLLDLIIIEISSNNYQYKSRRRTRWRQTGSHELAGENSSATDAPAGDRQEQPDPPWSIRSATVLKRQPVRSEASVRRSSCLAPLLQDRRKPNSQIRRRNLGIRQQTGDSEKSWTRTSPSPEIEANSIGKLEVERP